MTTDARTLRDIAKIQRKIDRLTAAGRFPKTNPLGGGVPGAGDDRLAGYSVFSLWHFAADVYICVDSTAAAAVWKIIT